MAKLSWQSIAAAKRHELEDAISEYKIEESLLDGTNTTSWPSASGLLSPRELKITESRAVDLVEKLRSRDYSAVEVTVAFCKRAAIAQQATNCIALVLFKEAVEQARALDECMEKKGKPIGPLHGLPISVKEHIFLKGTPATSGLIAWKDVISPHDALIVKILREAGAVFHVKTTNPQTLMALETDSNLFGRTVNPFNRNLTPGGSSGGESAIIAMRGSPLGIGTDIGGSIRAPSAFCGGWGLKPSVARIPHGGLTGLHAGMENIIGCVGPMANSVEDLRLFCKVALDYEPWDHEPSLIGIPWRSTTVNDIPKKLTIGVIRHDGIVAPHPPIARAMEETIDALRAAGHDIVDWDPKYHLPLLEWIGKAYFLDGAQEYRDMTGPSDPAVPIIKWLVDEAGERCTLEDSWQCNRDRDYLRTCYAEQWRSMGIDAILCPANASAASAHGESRYWGYTSVFNVLDLPGVVFPVTCVKETDTRASTLPIMSPKDQEYRDYYKEGPAKYRDAPICLQLVGRRLQEEKLLAMAESVQLALTR
ncbi:hypothetical protein AAFC00_006521 [Neodothiora populina]|uniref:amidase n=1 Tax=Neodothiora populina TaxID=2781224 RepID=A0ABR3PA78_9PEZI